MRKSLMRIAMTQSHAMLLLTGAVVGALHGWVLVRMVEEKQQQKLIIED